MSVADHASTSSLDGITPSMTSMRKASLVDRLLAWRDRTLASPRFQHGAARFLPTRWIARRRARALFDLVAGFTYSQVLLACVRLGWFERLLEAPRSTGELGEGSGLDAHAVERLVAAAVSLRLLERRRDDRVGLGVLGAAMAGNVGIAAMVEHHTALYADLADPVALLRRQPSGDPFPGSASRSLNAVWGYAANDAAATLDAGRVAAYSALMTQSQPLVAVQVLDAFPMARHRRLLDVGGGEGAFAMTAAARHPHLHVAVFDLPAVAERAATRLHGAGLTARSTSHGGDFVRDPLPTGYDLVSLVRVVHDHDDDRALRILRNVHAALPDDGVLLLAEPMAGTPGAEPMGDAYFGLYLFAMGSGRPRTAAELTAMLRQAGFTHVREHATSLPIQTRVLSARK